MERTKKSFNRIQAISIALNVVLTVEVAFLIVQNKNLETLLKSSSLVAQVEPLKPGDRAEPAKIQTLDGNTTELRFNAVRGLYYKVLTSTNVAGPYSDGGNPGQVALEASVASTNSLSEAQKFFRISASLNP